MAREIINPNSLAANDGLGDSPFVGMQKVNANFLELYTRMGTAESNISAKAPIQNPTFQGTVNGITATMVGLGNVDNTSDANKPVSTAQNTAIVNGDNLRLKVADLFADFVATGLATPVPNNTNVGVMSPGVAYVNGGIRVQKLITDADLTFSYVLTRDTYVDIDSSGVLYRTDVPNGTAAPSLVAGRLRIEKVITNASAITSVTRLVTNRNIGLATAEVNGFVPLGLAMVNGVHGNSLVDEFGNAPDVLQAQWVGRRDSLANLQSTSLNSGEVAVVSDYPILAVNRSGFAQVGRQFMRAPAMGIAVCYNAPNIAAANTDYILSFDVGSNDPFDLINGGFGSGLIKPMKFVGNCSLIVEGGIEFPYNASATFYKVKLQYETGVATGVYTDVSTNKFYPNGTNPVVANFKLSFLTNNMDGRRYRLVVTSDAAAGQCAMVNAGNQNLFVYVFPQ